MRHVYDAARDRIEALLDEGVPRSIEELARRAWCSRGVATAVVAQLASEGAVVPEPHRGWRRPDAPSTADELLGRVLAVLADAYGAAPVGEIAEAVGAARDRVYAVLCAAEAAGGAARVRNGLAPRGWVITPAGRSAVSPAPHPPGRS